jgi:ketosteroid isomerase-like protein
LAPVGVTPVAEGTPIPPPIPGRLKAKDPRDPVQALARFYRAFNDRDLERMDVVWEHSSEASVISPLVGLTRGWSAIRETYVRGFQAPMTITTEFYDYTTHSLGDLFCAIGRERGRATSPSGVQELEGHATNIFRRTKDGLWKLVHHHVSIAGSFEHRS